MKVEQTPITGREDKGKLTPQIRAVAQFYEAFNNRDLELMAKNWAGTDEIVMDNPLGGIKRGWEEIKSVYENIFGGKWRVTVEFYDYSYHESAEIFFVAGRERGTLKSDNRTIDLSIRTTRIFRLIDGEWRQIHHHGSMDDAGLLADYQKAVKGK